MILNSYFSEKLVRTNNLITRDWRSFASLVDSKKRLRANVVEKSCSPSCPLSREETASVQLQWTIPCQDPKYEGFRHRNQWKRTVSVHRLKSAHFQLNPLQLKPLF